jgi:hypothetical protein
MSGADSASTPGADNMPTPRWSAVVPRAFRSGGTARLPLDQLVTPLLRQNVHGLFLVLASPGAGKTTALQ